MTGELNGVDLARQALVVAREAAKRTWRPHGESEAAHPTVVRRDTVSRLGAATTMMNRTRHGGPGRRPRPC